MADVKNEVLFKMSPTNLMEFKKEDDMNKINWAEEFENVKDTFEYKLEKLTLDITEDIVKLMEKENVSRKGLADKLGVSKPSISNFLNQGSNMTIKRILAITEELNSEIEIIIKHKSASQKKIKQRVDYSAVQKQNVIQLYQMEVDWDENKLKKIEKSL